MENNMSNTTVKELFTKEEYLNLISTFREFVKDPQNKPYKCESYGTKYSGNVTLLHFVLYAVLRGKSPTKTTHDVESEKYCQALRDLETLKEGRSVYGVNGLEKAFGLDPERLSEVLKGLLR